MTGIALGYERFARVVLMIFVVQIAFLVHMVLGAVLAGFFPSVAATTSTFRTWVLAEDRSWSMAQTWTVFHRAWSDDLGPANAFGWPQLVVGLFLAWEYYVVNWNDTGITGIAVSGLLLVAGVAYGVFAAVSWVVRAHLAGTAGWIVRVSLRLVVVRPVCTVAIATLLLATAWVWWTWPGILMTFGLSAPIFGVVVAVHAFGRLPGMGLHRTDHLADARKDAAPSA
ncbi:YesL family protein [Brachybacterium hainanense]|uniref:YesL family protein n=1 Tax=Brachybacterium hainanense TaxID=1541174 RepID=A0ABV6RDY1_9MICO